MRIIQLVESMNVGGLEVMALDLARRQKSHGHDVRLYCLYERGKLADHAEAAGIPVTVFGKSRGFSPKLVARVVSALNRDKPDVIHSHNPAVHTYAAISGKIAGVPAIINTRHGPVMSDGSEYRHWIYRLVQPITNRVVFVSEHCKSHLVNELRTKPEKSCVVINGIECAKFQGPRRAKNGVFRFGTVGRMVPMKGHEILVRAFASVANRMPDAELRIVGGGPGLSSLKELAERVGCASRIRLDGPTSDVPSVLADLDVFVMSSISEGLPLAILEAMAAGLPIVSTHVGGIPEVLPSGKGIWLCEPGSESSLASALLAAYEERDGDEVREHIAKVARERYDLEAMYGNYLSVYQQAIERN